MAGSTSGSGRKKGKRGRASLGHAPTVSIRASRPITDSTAPIAGTAACDRIRLPTDYSEIKNRLRFGETFVAPNSTSCWHTSPPGKLLCAVYDSGTRIRRPALMRWGLIPGWASDDKIGYATFNARADSIDSKPAFRGAWRAGRRCLIVTNGFFGVRKADKQLFAVGKKGGGPMVMAGLWEKWRAADGGPVTSCTIITTGSCPFIRELCDRMPVILAEKDWPAWLGEAPAGNAVLRALLVPCPGEQLVMWPVPFTGSFIKQAEDDSNRRLRTIRPTIDDEHLVRT